MKDYPVFVVVGHPNKGKSSIVSTLTMDDSIAISDTPGTTKKSRSFFLKVDGKIWYELIDTPGFQRPRKLLKYLKSFGDVSAIDRPKLLKKFVQEFKDDESYHDEIELLKPIIKGAGIIYVVDASKPFSKEYEMEMEILRYAGNPSIAILNYIGEEDFTKEWDIVLGQYFRLVKRFNPITSSKREHIDLLEALSHINPLWQDSMKKVIEFLESYHENIYEDIAKKIVATIKDVLSFSITTSYDDSIRGKNEFKKSFREKINSYESKMQRDILKILRFKNIDIEVKDSRLEFELFSKRAREIFGLKKEKLLLLSAISGGVLGGSVDLALGGHTFLLGSILGAVGAVASALYGYEELSKIKFISKDRMKIGPIKDINFGFIFLNRALFFAKKMLLKTHANREKESISFENIENFLSDEDIKTIAKIHQKFKNKKDSVEDYENYVTIVKNVLKDR